MSDFIPTNESTEISVIKRVEIDINETHFKLYEKEDIIKDLTKGYSPDLPEVVKDEMLENVVKVLNIPDIKSLKVIKSVWSDGAVSFRFDL